MGDDREKHLQWASSRLQKDTETSVRTNPVESLKTSCRIVMLVRTFFWTLSRCKVNQGILCTHVRQIGQPNQSFRIVNGLSYRVAASTANESIQGDFTTFVIDQVIRYSTAFGPRLWVKRKLFFF